jgi:hypothetical protein
LQSDEYRLCFGVAETDVVLKHTRAVLGEHKPDEQDAAEVETVGASARKRRLDDLADGEPQRLVVEHARRGDSAHASRVRPRVALADALVVARWRHQAIVAPVRPQ